MVRLDEYEMKLLAEIKAARDAKNSMNKSHKAIVSDLIRKLHAKECK